MFRFQKGFTLLELLVAIAIIGLISNIAIAVVQNSREKARLSGAQQFAQQVHQSFGASEVLRWTFEGTTVNDESGNGRNGTYNGATVATGIVGQAASFDGNDFIYETSDPPNFSQPWTISLWVKPNALQSGGAGILSSRNGSSVDHAFEININSNSASCTGRYGFAVDPAGLSTLTQFCFNSPLDTFNTDWTYIVVVKSGMFVKIYRDGKKALEQSINSVLFNGTIDLLTLGKSLNTVYYGGLIDEVNIYREALDVGQIEKLYAEGLKTHKIAQGQ